MITHALAASRSKRRVASLLCLAFIYYPVLAQQESPLTLDMAVQLALERNERSLATREAVASAEAAVTRARAFFLPALTTTGAYTRRPFEVRRTVGATEIIVQRFNALSGVASLNMTLFDSKSIPGLNSANALQKSAVAAATESKRQLAFEVSQAFLATLSTGQVLEASRHRYDFARQNLDAARARYSAGLASVNDVTLAELEAATAEVGMTQGEGQLETSTLQLGYLLDAPSSLTKSLVVPEFLIQAAQGEAADAEKLVAEAQVRRLDLASLRWLAKSQHARVLDPLLRWLPSLSLGGQYWYTNEAGLTGQSTNWNIGMTLSWSIFDGFTRNADYKDRKAQAEVADLNVRASIRQVDIDVREALVSLASQRASLKQATVAHEVAKKNAAETTELYRQGLASALQVADANVRLFEAEVTLVSQRYGLGIAFLNLEAALGLDPFGKEPIH
ncbi:MAG: TolC family protein [Candidatus Aminicenantales bacterium]